MAAIKPLDRITSKFTDVTPARSGEYEAGIRAPRRSWSAATAAAEDSYKAGVAAAAARGAFGKGVKAAGDAKYQKGALEKGVARFGPGVALSGDDYAKGFKPYHDAISRLSLPPRYARRDPRNLQRVAAVATELGKIKESMGK